MKVMLEMLGGRKITVTDIKEFNFIQTAGVPCDGLWMYFSTDGSVDEICRVKAYEGDRLIFNGFCDTQKSTENASGSELFVFARSGAALLVDNEAEPFTYDKPSAKQLCFTYARKYGFVSKLPEIYSNMKYEVVKGTSCYGAISNFVSLLTGNSIAVTPENEITLLTASEDVRHFSGYNIISLKHTINRSEPYSQILYKKSYREPRYSVHTEAVLADELGINRSVYMNLSSLPQWQRENAVAQRLRQSYRDYKVLELEVSGYADEPLLQRFNLITHKGRYENYQLTEKKYVRDKYGDYTRLTLKKITDIKERTYVD